MVGRNTAHGGVRTSVLQLAVVGIEYYNTFSSFTPLRPVHTFRFPRASGVAPRQVVWSCWRYVLFPCQRKRDLFRGWRGVHQPELGTLPECEKNIISVSYQCAGCPHI